MKKLLILLFFVTSLQAQEVWEGEIVKVDTVGMNDTVVYKSLNIIGKDCSCTFDVSTLDKDSSYVKFGGSNLFLNTYPRKYPGFIEFSDSLVLDTTVIQVVNFRTQGDTLNINDTTHFITYSKENYSYMIPMLKWYLNGVTSGILKWRCLFYKRD